MSLVTSILIITIVFLSTVASRHSCSEGTPRSAIPSAAIFHRCVVEYTGGKTTYYGSNDPEPDYSGMRVIDPTHIKCAFNMTAIYCTCYKSACNRPPVSAFNSLKIHLEEINRLR